MFLKTSEIKAFIVYTSLLNIEEYNFIQENLNTFSVLYLIPHNEECPHFLSENDLVLKEERHHFHFDYENLLKQAVNLLGEPSNKIVVISKSIKHLSQMLSQPIGTILISNDAFDFGDTGFLPDIKLNNFNELKRIDSKMGFFSEVIATILPTGSSFNDSGLIFGFKMERDDYTFEIIAGGRYFKTKHECYQNHQLSFRINKSKYENTQDKIFTQIFIPIINRLKENNTIHGITRVPSRPGKRDRLKPIVESIVKVTGLEDYCKYLVCPEDYPSHKHLSKDMRYKNVRGRFKVIGNFTGQHIVIIDDVFTTGATIFECAKQFLNAGALKVTAIILGVNQFSNEFVQRNIYCPLCESKLVLRINSGNNTIFYGCENFPDCRYSETFLNGWKRTIEENSIKPEEEIESYDEWLF